VFPFWVESATGATDFGVAELRRRCTNVVVKVGSYTGASPARPMRFSHRDEANGGRVVVGHTAASVHIE
jgi:hypothetical protein